MTAGANNDVDKTGTGTTDTSSFEVVTAVQKDVYEELDDRLEAFQLPRFLDHDEVVERYWGHLTERFPEYQFLLVDAQTRQPVGRGHSIPLRYDDEWPALPGGGLDWALSKGFQDQENGSEANVVSALFVVVAKNQLGRGLSYRMLAAMRNLARERGFPHLIAPVRPCEKYRYPLIPMEDYCRWTRPDGSPYDPWLRVHVRSGGIMLHPCPRAMVVRGTLARWSEWVEVDFPGDGCFILPGGLVPLQVDRRSDHGTYLEPGVWILHETGTA